MADDETTAEETKAEEAAPAEEVEDDDEDEGIDAAQILAVCAEYKKATSASDLKEALEEFDVKTPKAASKLGDEERAELHQMLTEALNDDEDEDDEDDESSEEAITVDAVKKAAQAYAKENSKDELKEILEEYDIKTAAKISSLDEDDLEDLYAELTE